MVGLKQYGQLAQAFWKGAICFQQPLPVQLHVVCEYQWCTLWMLTTRTMKAYSYRCYGNYTK